MFDSKVQFIPEITGGAVGLTVVDVVGLSVVVVVGLPVVVVVGLSLAVVVGLAVVDVVELSVGERLPTMVGSVKVATNNAEVLKGFAHENEITLAKHRLAKNL